MLVRGPLLVTAVIRLSFLIEVVMLVILLVLDRVLVPLNSPRTHSMVLLTLLAVKVRV